LKVAKFYLNRPRQWWWFVDGAEYEFNAVYVIGL